MVLGVFWDNQNTPLPAAVSGVEQKGRVTM
jgi:hypothetical protein